jgi:hypothetical protein
MKTISIKGKDYIPVNEKLKYFREHFPNYSLQTKVIKLDDSVVVMQASVENDQGRVIATGTAYEKADSSFINKTSYIENCETSAWGRALSNFGIGIDASVASAEEVATAVNNQKTNTDVKLPTGLKQSDMPYNKKLL